MRIPLPCKFGETFEYKGKSLKLLSVSKQYIMSQGKKNGKQSN